MRTTVARALAALSLLLAARSEAAIRSRESFDPCGRLGAMLPGILCVAVPALLIAGGVAYSSWQNRSARS